MNLRKGENIEKDKASAHLFSVSGLVLSLAGIFSSTKKTVSVNDENSSLPAETRIAEIANAQNGAPSNSPAPGSANAENRVSSDNPAFGGARHEKSVLELIKLDFKQHRRAVIAISAVFLLLSAFFFYNYMKAGVVLLSLIAMGAVSRAWQRFFPLEFGIELVMLATVISGFTYGAAAGLIVGFVSLVASTLLTQEDPGKMWPAFITIMVIGFLAGTLTIANIAMWGVIFTVLYDAIISAIYISSGHSAIKTLIFDATHIAFNYFVFYNIAPALVSIIA